MIHTENPQSFLVGTYTNKKSEGIYKFSIDSFGKLTSHGVCIKTNNPSFIAQTNDNKYLLCVNESGKESSIESYKLCGANKHCDDTYKRISKKASGGDDPCFIAVNENGYVLVSNYNGGNVSLFLLQSNGELSDILDSEQHYGKGITTRQDKPHAHSSWFIPDTNQTISLDLGNDELTFSSIESDRFSTINQYKIMMKSGSGPRHVDFHPNGAWIYVLNELSSTITRLTKKKNSYKVDETISTIPVGYSKENRAADIHISNDGKFLYCSNRGDNSIAIFVINDDGKLSPLSHCSTFGDGPRSFTLTENENYVIITNQESHNIVSLKRDPFSGLLTFVDSITIDSPVHVVMRKK